MTLTKEQQFIFDNYIHGKNIFITGPGGCGKSYIIKHIVNHAKERFGNKVCVTALTGCAALLLECGATTLHSWSNIGLGKGDFENICSSIQTNYFKRKNWKSTKLLIIDEVSMMSKHLFELLDYLGKQIRNSSKPFGGMQLLFSGDFYQLPPVGSKNNPDSSKFCFESELWNKTFHHEVYLTTPFRQNDSTFFKILMQIRKGKLYKKEYQLIKQCINKSHDNLLVSPVQLYATKQDVVKVNTNQLHRLPGKEYIFKASLFNEYNQQDNIHNKPSEQEIEREYQYLLKNAPVDQIVSFKVGSQVMCKKNISLEDGIINGTTGIITAIHDDGVRVTLTSGIDYLFTQTKFYSEKYPFIGISQIPLILAWAITIHKSQGSTLEHAEMDLGNSIFSDGQIYVALSRVKNMNGLYLKSFNPQKIKTNPKVITYYNKFYT